MSATLPLQEWLRFIDGEYLASGFIRDGGAAVKFAVTPDPLKDDLQAAVRRGCRDHGLAFACLDAAEVRVHMPQDIFFGLARQVDWRVLARRLVLRMAARRSYAVEGMNEYVSGNIFDAIADANGLEKRMVLQNLRPALQEEVFRNPNMVRDFRVAMCHLCEGEDVLDSGAYNRQPVLDWLKGDNARLGSVRPFGIYGGINRTTARYFIQSTLYWIQFCGGAGTVLLLDNSRVTVARNPRDDRRYYTRAMALDHYELLREFVDDIDRLPGMLLFVMTCDEFLDESAASRGYGVYPALRTRIMNDVRDRNLANPVASLVRLS